MASSSNSTRYNVFQVRFKLESGVLHIALFVQTGKAGGVVFHAINAETDDDRKNGYMRLKLEEKPDVDPTILSVFVGMDKVGTMLASDLGRLRSICQNTPEVVAPEETLKPDCVTWIENVLYDLYAKNVVSFHPRFPVPTTKQVLQVRRKETGRDGSQ